MPGFDDARRAAVMGDLLRHLRGRPTELLPFEAVREGLRLRSLVDRGVEEVPLDRIVGTYGREGDFNRAFLPREEALRERWEGVERLAEGPRGFPPVELYKVGEAFFVVDGHHRVSVARSIGSPSIEARVQEFLTAVPLPVDASIEEILATGGLADFLAASGLPTARREEFRVTEPGGYQRLLDHVAGHRYFRGQERRREIPWEEAVRSWDETVFRPMVGTIRASGILEEFPGRSEADLFLFTMDHLHYLRQRFGPSEVEPRRAVEEYAASRAPKAGERRWRRWLDRWRRGRR